jgi:hypothetical protein
MTRSKILFYRGYCINFIRQIARRVLPRFIRAMRSRAAEIKRHKQYQDLSVDRVFSAIYETNEWGGDGQFYSGNGSHDPAIVEPYVAAVREVLRLYKTKPVVVDIGSGDFNVGKNFLDLVEHYHACDIVVALQKFNQVKYLFDNVSFACINAVDDPLPSGDMIIIRQVLQHLSNSQITKIIQKCNSFSSWIITEHLPNDQSFKPNRDITAGCGIRTLFNSGVDLLAPPFSIRGYTHRVLCEIAENDGVIRTTLFVRELELLSPN